MNFHKVVIVGGGLAGLAAAKTLFQNGVQDILLVEAKSRLGGRVHTVLHGGGPLELGAQWIHGEEGNDICILAKQIDCLYHFKPGTPKREWPGYYDDEEDDDDDKEDEDEDGDQNKPSKDQGFYLSDSTPVSKKLVKEAFSKFDDVLDEAETYFRNEKSIAKIKNEKVSIGQFIEDHLQKYLTNPNSKKIIQKDQETIKRALIDWRYLTENLENSCSSIWDIPLAVWGEYYLCEGEEGVEMGPRGYQPILDYLAKGLPESCVKLNTVVESIEWFGGDGDVDSLSKNFKNMADVNNNANNRSKKTENDEIYFCCKKDIPDPDEAEYLELMNQVDDKTLKKVIRNVKDDTLDNVKKLKVHLNSGETIATDHIIVTLPLGVLKHLCGFRNFEIPETTVTNYEFFKPSLPNVYLNSIDNLACGTIDKIFLEFENPFWESDNGIGFQFVWRRGEVVQLNCLKKYGRSYENTKWYQSMQGFNTLLQHSNIICGWVSGSAAVEMERESDDLVRDVCLELLEKFSGKPVGQPVKMIRSRWALDPFSRGAYSYRNFKSSYVDSLQLARALPSDEDPRLLLAGEATHCHFYSTTHGAMITGIDQAHKIIDYYS